MTKAAAPVLDRVRHAHENVAVLMAELRDLRNELSAEEPLRDDLEEALQALDLAHIHLEGSL